MQTGIMRPTPELLIGLTLSLLLHGALLHFKAMNRPAEPQLSPGRTAVELTLRPAMSAAPAKPVPVPEPRPEESATASRSSAAEEAAVLPLPEPLSTEIQPPTPAEPAPQDTAASQEHIASMEETKGALTDAEPIGQCAPVYPAISQRRGEEGTVVLSVDISAAGRPSNITIVESSKHHRLDNAAIKAVKAARFNPALRFGQPVETTLTMPFKFELTQ